MGAESSTLQSVESLNQTLLNVEQRLFDIENFHLHHERNVTLENQLFICGKSIRCNSHVNLVIGPVLGVVNASNARILIEVNTKTELECHLFKQVESFTENRYYKSFSFDIIGNKPYCMVLDNLDQDTLYLAYIGGIKQEDVVYNVVQFYTSSSADRMRYFLSSKALVDSSIPSETCLLENISTKINYSCQLQQNQNSSHYYINIGGFLNVQEIVRKYAYELLRLIQADQFRSETWNSILNSFEKDVKIRYVNAFRESTFAGLARKCSILLFAGEEETAAAVLQSMMKNDEDIVIDDSSSLQESISTSLKSKMSRSKSTMVNDKSIFSKNVRESKNKIDNVAMLSKDDQKELKLLTISLVGRVLRKISSEYYRQLWDEKFSPNDIDQMDLECLLRKILVIKRNIMLNRSLKMSLDLEFSRVSKSSAYSSQIQAHIDQYNSKIGLLKEQLSEVVVKSSDIKTRTLPFKSSDLILFSEGIICFVDFSWDWIGHNGIVKFPLPLQVELDHQIMKNLENALDTSLNLKSIIMVFCNPFLPSSIGASFRCSVGDTNRLFSCLNKWQAGHIDRAVMWIGKSAENHIAEIGVLQATDTDKLDLVRSGIKTCFLDSLQQPFMPGLLQSLKSSIVQVDATSVAVKEVADFVFESNISFASSCFSMLNFQRYDPFPPSCSEFVACFEGKEQLTLRPTFGVICGYISSSSATLMLECSRSGYVELTCVDGLTGREHSLSKFVAGGTPAEFHFINLASFRNYDVLINKIKFSTDANTLFTSCNFTTLKRFSSMRLTGEKNILQDLRSVNVEQSIVQSIPSEAKLPQNGDNLEMDRMQILILGSVYTLPSSSKTMNFLSLPRVMCQPWNGINLIIHGPGSIDWRSAVLSAFSYISTVDRVCDTDEIVGIELKIYSIFKDAIRKSFNDDMAFHHCLRNTANYFTSSAIADLVVAMNTFNIQDVVQDTSEFAVNAIISSISKVQIEYFTKLWRYEINEDAFALSYIDETNTIMFEIKPNYSYTEGFHISSRHVSAIRSVLSRDIFKDLYTKLLLVSPFPLITGDTMSEKYSFIQSNSSFYCCDSSQSMVLLDVCYEWLKNSAKRELVLVCWSNTGVFTTSVTGELKQKNGATHDLQHNSVSVNENSVFGVGEEMISQQSPLEINHELASSHVPVFYQVCSTISSDIVESSSFSTQGKLYNMDGFYHFKFHHTFESMTENYNIVGIPWNPDAKQIAITLLKADNDYFLNYADDLEANEVIDQLSEFSSYESMMELVSNYLSEDTLKVNTSIDILHDIQLAVRNLLRVEDKTILAIFDQVKMESAELTLSLSYLMHIHHIFVKLYCRFSVSTRDILCLPSRFATFCTIQKCLAFKTPDDSSPLQKLIIQLTTSVDYFKEFAIVAFTVQLFLEQLSLKFGLLD